MALSRFVLPYADVGAGIRPSSGAKLFFYATGTSTLKSTFTDATGSTANTNPVIANANGVFPAIFFNGSFNVALKDSNNVQLWTADPVNSKEVGTIYATTLDLIASEQAANSNDIVECQGYTTKGDGGGAQWKQNGVTGQTVSQSPAQLGDALLNDANGNQWALVVLDKINVKTLGALGDRATDDTAVIQAAIDYAGSLIVLGDLRLPVALPAGSYLVSSTLYMDVGMTSIVGDGWSSELYRTTDYGHTILVSDTRADSGVLTSITRTSIKNIAINCTIKPSSGAHIFCIAINQMTISGVLLRGGVFQGIHLKGAVRVSLLNIRADLTDNLYTTAPSTDSAFIVTSRNGSGATAYALANVGNCRIENIDTRIGLTVATYSPFQVGLDIRSSDGIWASKIYMKSSTLANFRLSPMDDYSSVIGANITQSWSDHSGNHGILIEGEPTSANIAYNHFSKFVMWGAGEENWGITNNSSKLKLSTFDDIKIFSMKQSGINLAASGGRLGFNLIQAFDCNTLGTVSDSVFDISGGVSNFSITNSFLGGTTVNGATASSDYGIKIRTGASDNYIITNNQLMNNVTAGIIDQGTGVNKVVTSNIS